MDTEAAAGDQQGVVIASTNRLARRIRDDHDREQLATGRMAWLSSDVLPWDAWVDRCWHRLRDIGGVGPSLRALSDEQERLVWEEAVRDSSGALDRLMMPREIAREAQRAWHLAGEYRIPRDELVRCAGVETRQLLGIARRVGDRLQDEGWCGRGQRQAMVTGSASLASVAPRHLTLAGFDELTPAQAALIDALSEAGTALRSLPAPQRDSVTHLQRCVDPESELQHAAMAARRWLQEMLEVRIGIVVPDLEQRAEQVEEIFDDILTPGRLMPGAMNTTRPWSISLGRGLSEWPVVDAALRLLSLLFGDAEFTDISRLLRSPFVGGGAELPSRGLLDGWLRERGVYRLGAAGLVRMLTGPGDRRRPTCPDLLQRLERLTLFRDGLPRQAPPDRWAALFGEALGVLGWPGDRPLDSVEFQCVKKWHQVLAMLASTGQVTGTLIGTACLDQLARLAGEATFQPESRDPPVQVLGLLETPGLMFDALWIAGMHHLAWPRPVRPNALIPASLQRAHRMPRSCPAVELEFCRNRMVALSGSAREVVFSWPAQIDDEQLRPSPLLNGINEDRPPGEAWRNLANRGLGAAATERLEDYRLRPLPPGGRARGGSAIVRWQSACPFQAQARSRLDCRSLQQPGPGVRAVDSGSIAHLALQWLWQDWGDSATPARMSRNELTAAVDGAAARACSLVLNGEGDLARTFVELESRRAAARMLALLEQDLAREPFAVAAVEHCTTPELEGIEFSLRIDRVDRLPDGSLLLIDYKTGRVNVSDWHGERPREPQLPFYAVTAADGQICGVAFGCLRVGEEGYSGYAAADVRGTDVHGVGSLKKPPDGAASWEELTAQWERRLTGLIGEFANGDARVDPRSVSQDCRYCDLSPLCRRHELALSTGLENA